MALRLFWACKGGIEMPSTIQQKIDHLYRLANDADTVNGTGKESAAGKILRQEAKKLETQRKEKAQPTAKESYAREHKAVTALLNQFTAVLAGHAQRQSKDDRNWGYVGDMAHYREQLEEMLGLRG